MVWKVSSHRKYPLSRKSSLICILKKLLHSSSRAKVFARPSRSKRFRSLGTKISQNFKTLFPPVITDDEIICIQKKTMLPNLLLSLLVAIQFRMSKELENRWGAVNNENLSLKTTFHSQSLPWSVRLWKKSLTGQFCYLEKYKHNIDSMNFDNAGPQLLKSLPCDIFKAFDKLWYSALPNRLLSKRVINLTKQPISVAVNVNNSCK